MSIALSYDETLSGVHIDLSETASKRVIIERSVNEILWNTVRGGVNVEVDLGATLVVDYEFVSDTENFYRITPTHGPGLVLDGEIGNYASTPNHLDFVVGSDDLDIRAFVTPETWKTQIQVVVAKYVTDGDQRSYYFRINSSGHLQLAWSPDGTLGNLTIETSTVPVPAEDRNSRAIRATLTLATGAVRFYTATGMDGPWSQLGATRIASPATVNTSSAPLEVGSHSNGTDRNFSGVIHAVEVRRGINGPVQANPIFEDQPDGTTSFADSTGKTWTVHENAVVGNEVIDSITPSLDGEVWLKSVRYPGLNQVIEFQDYSDIEMAGNASIEHVSGRSRPVATTDVRNGMSLGITLNTEDEEAVRKLMLTLAVGDIFFLHVPPNEHPALPPKSFYFVRESTRVERWQDHVERRLQHFQVVEVVPPGPEFSGVNLTWGTVLRLFGSSTQLINANPSWKELLLTVGDPEDLVVL